MSKIEAFAASQPAEIKEWISGINQLLTEKGCKSTYQKNMHTGDGYEYYHKKTNIRICKIAVSDKGGCFIMLHGNHFSAPYCIVNELPDNMLYPLKNQRGCRPCADPRICTMPGNGERYYEFTHNGRNYLCCGGGFRYDLNDLDEKTNLNLLKKLKKWIEAELRWYENDLAAYPEKKIILDEIESSYAKRWVKNRIKTDPIGEEFYIFEPVGKEQALVKPSIEAARDYFLKDEKSNADMTRLIDYLRDSGAEVKWKAKNKYVFRHKKTELIYFRLEGLDDFNILICAVYWWESKNVYQEFVDSLPAGKKKKYVATKELNCHECNEICNKRMRYVVSGKEYILCSSKPYLCENPTAEKLDEIEWLIDVSRDYIDFKIARSLDNK
jgi:hypothetical protein